MAVSAAQVKALATINTGKVFVANNGQTSVKGFTSTQVKALRKAGLATLNGASRMMLPDGRSARKAVLTAAGKAALPTA